MQPGSRPSWPWATACGSRGSTVRRWTGTKGVAGGGSRDGSDADEPVFPLCLRRALAVNPAQSSTHSALGLTYQLLGDPFKAVEAFHSALALRPDDALATEMLGVAVSDAAGEAHGWA